MRLFSSLNFLFIESGNEKRKGFLRELKRLKKVDKSKAKKQAFFLEEEKPEVKVSRRKTKRTNSANQTWGNSLIIGLID